MKKTTKKLQEAFSKIDSLPDDWFGSESASFEDLPSISAKQSMTRTSAYIKNDDLIFLKAVSKNTHVSVAQITGDIVSKFVQDAKKKKRA